MTTLLGVLVLLSPLLFFFGGYYVGRYGSPIRISLHRPRDRRRRHPLKIIEDTEEDVDVDVYRAG